MNTHTSRRTLHTLWSSVRAHKHMHTHSKTHASMPAVDAVVLTYGALNRPLAIKRHTDGGSSFHRANFSAVHKEKHLSSTNLVPVQYR